MDLFQKADIGHSHLKMGIMGLAGSGKTYTASVAVIGLVGYMNDKQVPVRGKVAFIDTENGSAWVSPRFAKAGIELVVARTRALTDLRDAINWAEKNADALIIDSITHFWTLFCEEYAIRKNRKRGLEFSDWNAVKREWRVNFTDLYLNSRLHIAMCGRQGYEYDMQVNDAGKKELVKTGVKMKAEGETGFEPSLLIQMEQEQTLVEGSVAGIERVATVLKDRSTMLDGQSIRNPKFVDFLPHIRVLDLGGTGVAVDTSRHNGEILTDDGDTQWRRQEMQRTVALEEIEAEIVKMYPSQDKDSKTEKANLIEELFGTRSWTAVSAKRLDVLTEARNKLWLKSRGHAYGFLPPVDNVVAENAA